MSVKCPLILISNKSELEQRRGFKREEFPEPRYDFLSLVQRLEGSLSTYKGQDSAWSDVIHRLERYSKIDLREAMAAAQRFNHHNAIISTSEKLAIPLAMMAPFVHLDIPHILIAHKLSSKSKKLFFKMRPIDKSFDHIICVCQSQIDYAVNELRMPRSKVSFVYHNIDHVYYHPVQEETEDFILTVGREQRDYKNLLQAIAGTGINLAIVPSSAWSPKDAKINNVENLRIFSRLKYHELRALYARAKLVILPLFDVDYAAGATSLLEAMAMGKAVITTKSRGISDYVIQHETGVIVPPENPMALREAILSLWNEPKNRKRLGANARLAVEEDMNIDIYTERVANIVEKQLNGSSIQ